eukprot:428679-Karenia_brevis.AAC.1
MPLVHSDWQRPWLPMVYSYNASKLAGAVVERCWDRSQVSDHGRVPERRRFKIKDSVSARSAALSIAG